MVDQGIFESQRVGVQWGKEKKNLRTEGVCGNA